MKAEERSRLCAIPDIIGESLLFEIAAAVASCKITFKSYGKLRGHFLGLIRENVCAEILLRDVAAQGV